MNRHYEIKKLKSEQLRTPVMGMTVETFVRGYKGQSQMDVNTINGMDISGRGAKAVGDIHRAIKKHQ